ncbi:MAG: magnesium transporter CorA family protein [Patescibacteria group bacterium]|nr:magnesium transporter CorA family protein [Patescibacteria group bacterium]
MRKIIKAEKVTWIDIVNPVEKDINFLKQKFNIHSLVLEELLIPSYRPKVERYPNYLYMIFYYPIYSKEKRETKPREVDIIITKDTIITCHFRSILPIKVLFDRCNIYSDSRKRYMNQGAGHLLFYILNGLWKNCLLKLARVDKRIDEIEEKIFRGEEKEMVLEISLVKTDIINFWRIIEPQKQTLESLSEEGVLFFGKNLSHYFSDILGTFSQIWNSLQTYKEAILALENTNQSLLSAKINEIMKILTIFSVIFLPLTLIASIWGMNVDNMPFTNSSFGFWVLLVIMAVVFSFMLFYFYKKKWL